MCINTWNTYTIDEAVAPSNWSEYWFGTYHVELVKVVIERNDTELENNFFLG